MNVEETLINWTIREYEGKSFNDRVIFEQVPLGWLFEKMFFPEIVPYFSRHHTSMMNGWKAAVHRTNLRLILGGVKLLMRIKMQVAGSAPKTTTAEKKILFFAFSNQVRNKKIQRVEKLMNAMENSFPLIVSSVMKNKKHGLTQAYAYYDKNIEQKAQQQAAMLHNQVEAIPLDAIKKYFSSEEMWECVSPLFSFYFSKSMLYYVLVHYYMFEKIVREENIRAGVLTSSNHVLERAFIAAAHKQNVRSVIIQHGIGFAKRPVRDYCNSIFAVFGEMHKNRLVKSGIPSSNIKVTGPIVFEGIYKFKSLKKSRKKILITTQVLVEEGLIEKKKYFVYLRNIISQLKNVHAEVIIKMHPRERTIEEYKKLSVEYPFVHVHQQAGADDLYELMAQAGVMINFFGSSTILEASIMDVPSITIDFPSLTQSHFGDNDPSIRIQYKENITETVKKVLKIKSINREKRRALVKKLCGKIDGKETQRVIEIIRKIAK